MTAHPHELWHARLALLALAVGGFTIGTTEFASMSVLPQIAEGLHVDEPTAGHVISAYALGVVVGAPTIAVLGARLSRRILLVGLMGFFALAHCLSALSPNLEWMLAFRFMSGLPHGAYFGVGALVAASLVPRSQRTQAVARMMLGLTIATIGGVPFANLIGQLFGWRWCFVIVAVLALFTALMVMRYVPRDKGDPEASPLRELGALARPQVWLTLLIGAIGFGGMFAVYTYLASTVTEVTGVDQAMVPAALAVIGLGMTLGTLVCSWAADRWQMKAAGVTLVYAIIVMALYAPAAQQLWSMLVILLLIGCVGGLSSILQTRLMDVAGDAQTLAAALNHSAFNAANALGPWLGGMAITAGYGWTSTGWVGASLAIGGLLVWALSMALDRAKAVRQA